ncbi:MAG: helix-turn-helix domain-containing protein [Deltaproteobacteria bacterium]|nr:helix-turn-helix domain-containing protein [Deltaproteobacteria bacterium]MCW5803866.1 helix-turn-helix domain-containing protein [Deltaproteobacteria bacterium]
MMRLDARAAAALLRISETQLYRWVDEGDIPHAMVHHVPVFHRVELLAWALENELPVAADLDEDGPAPLADALERGGGYAIDQLDQLPSRLGLPAADRELARAVFRARRAEMFVTNHDGIAIPRAHSTLIAPTTAAVPLAWCNRGAIALDREPVRAIFVIVAPTIREHLRLLGHLSSAIRDAGVRAAIAAAAFAQVVAECRRVAAEVRA